MLMSIQRMHTVGLGSINDDVLVHIFSFLLPSEILCMRKASNFCTETLFLPTDEITRLIDV